MLMKRAQVARVSGSPVLKKLRTLMRAPNLGLWRYSSCGGVPYRHLLGSAEKDALRISRIDELVRILKSRNVDIGNRLKGLYEAGSPSYDVTTPLFRAEKSNLGRIGRLVRSRGSIMETSGFSDLPSHYLKDVLSAYGV